MPPRETTIDGGGPQGAPFSADLQASVKAELDNILKAPIFAQSNRCKRFLSYVVLQTLSGFAGDLKERTIGISVFDRTNDYDTGEDSIVRVTANEVRKRLGQYYAESAGVHPLQIELPRGSYVPEFRFQATRRGSKIAEAPEVGAVLARIDSVASDAAAPEKQPATIPGAVFTTRRRRRLFYLGAIIVVLLAGTAILGILKIRTLNRVPDVWSSFLHPSSPILVCIDTHQLPAPDSSSENGKQFLDMVLRKQIIALDDAAVLASVAAILGNKQIPFRVVGAEQTSLADLRRQPFILIGAIDNKWTIQLTKGLRYRIEVANPPNTGAARPPVASIVDSEHPTARWTTDLSVPFDTWKSDYAVIARMDDEMTGVPVLIVAGLGNTGTLAAEELLSSDAISSDIASEPSCRGRKNFEAVIETQIIDTKSGPPHVLRLGCW